MDTIRLFLHENHDFVLFSDGFGVFFAYPLSLRIKNRNKA